MLTRFWFKFKMTNEPSVFNLGCGITAYNHADAEKLLSEIVFPIYGAGSIKEIIKDVDVSTLDSNHVRPNMGDPAVRGVWFPLT